MDVRLEQVQESVEDINFLVTGYSILATADDGTVLAAGAAWDRETAEDVTTVRHSASILVRLLYLWLLP